MSAPPLPERAAMAADLPPGYALWTADSVTSTNDVARGLLRDAHPSAVQPRRVVWALRQTRGRGRGGRPWSSPPGGLWASVLLPDVEAAVGRAALTGLSLAAAVSMGEAIVRHLPERAGRALAHKWPNDLLLDGAKVCGLLLEAGQTPAPWVIIGAGVNVATAPRGTPYPAACLAAHGFAGTLGGLLSAWVARLDHWMARLRGGGAADARAAWLARCAGLGGPVTARLADGRVLDGVFEGLDGGGALLLRRPDGAVETIAAGDVFPGGAPPPR